MKIRKLNTISPEKREKIASAGIETLSALADLHTSPRRCLELSQDTGLSINEIREIISAALFSQINDIELRHSALLVKIGIDSISKLANSEEDKVIDNLTQYSRHQGEETELPSKEMLRIWIKRARDLIFAEAENYEA